jgi:hypothetical protein
MRKTPPPLTHKGWGELGRSLFGGKDRDLVCLIFGLGPRVGESTLQGRWDVL